VPAARSCAIMNVEICRDFYINLLVTDVILLFIMLAGLLRLRRDAGSFYLSQLLWKQVGPCWFLLVAMFLSHSIRRSWRSSGCHLARYCHRRRSSASGRPDQVYYCLYGFSYPNFTPQLLLFLNLNGSLCFLSRIAAY
jgi:hypothetical protein